MGTLQSVFFRPSRGYRKYTYDVSGAIASVEDTLYQLDGVVDEQHSSNVKITKHPVEYGVDISDHIIKQPKKVVVNGVVTNSPFTKQLLNVLPGDPTFVSSAISSFKGERARNAYQGLLNMQNLRKSVRLQTGLVTYDNMVLVGISAPNDIKSELRVKLVFEEIFIVTGESTGSTQAITSSPTDVDWATVAISLAGLSIAGLTFAS